MAEERRPAGSVAEETARLLDALLAGTPGDEEAGRPAYRTGGSSEPVEPVAPCPTCGHVPGATHATSQDGEVCHLCPVCQLLRVVSTVRPETLDRLADLAAEVTETLRDVAATRWRESGTSAPRRARPEVEDIRVKDDRSRARGRKPTRTEEAR
ncbi:MAG: hypothetical protein ABJA74_07215 [Lapillicoccus sp.]